MNRARRGIGASAAVVAAIALVWISALDRRQSRAPAAPRTPPPTREAAKPKPAPAAPVARPSPPATRAAAATSKRTEVTAQERVRAEVSVTQSDAAMAKATWAIETDDPVWTAEVSSHITSMLNDLQVAGTLDGVSCRQTLCMTRLKFLNAAEAERLSASAGDSTTPRWVDIQMHGDDFAVEVYLARGDGQHP